MLGCRDVWLYFSTDWVLIAQAPVEQLHHSGKGSIISALGLGCIAMNWMAMLYYLTFL